MDHNSDSENLLDNLIPNPAGIPGDEKDSERIRKEHRRWKKSLEQKKCKKVKQLAYWQKMSRCTSL